MRGRSFTALTGRTLTTRTGGGNAEATEGAFRAENRFGGHKGKLKDRLDTVDKKLQTLKAQSRPLSDKARRELDDDERFLEAKAKELRERIGSERKRDETWRKLQDSTESALNEIERKIDDLSAPRK